MICNKCGAPIPPGMDTCPHCGWKGAASAAAPRDTGFDDETSFVGAGAAQLLDDGPEETVYAGSGMAGPEETVFAGGRMADPLPGPEETQFAPGGAAPAREMPRPVASGLDPAEMAAKPRRGKAARPRPAQKQSLWKNPVLRAVLLVALAVLIVVLILR